MAKPKPAAVVLPPPMWRVWLKGQPDGAYWYVDADCADATEACRRMAKLAGRKADEYEAGLTRKQK